MKNLWICGFLLFGIPGKAETEIKWMLPVSQAVPSSIKQLSDTDIELSWQTKPDEAYIIQFKGDLSDKHWQDYMIRSSFQETNLTEKIPLGIKSTFFQIRRLPSAELGETVTFWATSDDRTLYSLDYRFDNGYEQSVGSYYHPQHGIVRYSFETPGIKYVTVDSYVHNEFPHRIIAASYLPFFIKHGNPNLIVNGKFESGIGDPVAWTKVVNTSNTNSAGLTESGVSGWAAWIYMYYDTPGEIGWVSDPVPVSSSKTYIYRSMLWLTGRSTLRLEFKKTTGEVFSQNFPNAFWCTDECDWQPYTLEFVAPQNVVSVRVGHYLVYTGSQPWDIPQFGNLLVDNVSLREK